MGCIVSKDDKAASERSKQIDERLKNDAQTSHTQVKLLLLGEIIWYIISDQQILALLLVGLPKCAVWSTVLNLNMMHWIRFNS